jgi:hypothetical protein
MEARQEVAPDLSRYSPVGDWQDRFGGAFFPTRSSVDWFIKTHREELIKRGALVARRGRNGSLLSHDLFPRAVLEIHRRDALSNEA